ncbi:MAG: ABC transporter ATP-binding protein [Candidatus Diapherotrites archaeon]|nr:ABC transporter ATP-binding protein [Candidatus Diapherotrites archaeon]
MNESVIELKNVSKTYDLGKVKVTALKNINIDIKKGEFVSIMGPSGSGKTTLLNVLSAMLRQSTGEIYIKGKPISKMNDSQLAKIRGKTIGFIFQTFNLIPRMTALQNVMFPLVFQNTPIEKRKKIAEKNLALVGLEKRKLHKSNELSGGERQRVAIARALANDPDIIVADEPTGNLDSKSGKQILEIITQLHKEGKTVLIVTHDQKIGDMAKRKIRVLDGEIISDTKEK